MPVLRATQWNAHPGIAVAAAAAAAAAAAGTTAGTAAGTPQNQLEWLRW